MVDLTLKSLFFNARAWINWDKRDAGDDKEQYGGVGVSEKESKRLDKAKKNNC